MSSKQVVAGSIEELAEIVAGGKARKAFQKESGLGYFHLVKASHNFVSKPLIPDEVATGVHKYFASKYDKGELPSKGYMHVKEVLSLVTRNVPAEVSGSLKFWLGDSGLCDMASIDGQEVEVSNSDLPAAILTYLTYDVPLEDANEGRRRCIHWCVGRDGYNQCFPGTSVASFLNFWKPQFKKNSNNYAGRQPVRRLVMPHAENVSIDSYTRLAEHMRSALNYQDSAPLPKVLKPLGEKLDVLRTVERARSSRLNFPTIELGDEEDLPDDKGAQIGRSASKVVLNGVPVGLTESKLHEASSSAS